MASRKLTDLEKLKQFMRMKPTLEDTAAFFEVSTRTVEQTIRDEFNLTFREFRDQNMVHTRHALIRKALEKALSGDNTMLIFCLKNMCGWQDKVEMESIGESVLKLKYAIDDNEETEKEA